MVHQSFLSYYLIILIVNFYNLNLIEASKNFADVPCGKVKSSRTGKIVGGYTALPGEFPWIVSLKRYGGHFCGGTIINEKWILTAAHCLCSGFSVLLAKQINVTFKEHDLSRPSSILTISVDKIIFHPNHICSSYNNDIALLELSQSIQWADRIRPACLPSRILDYSDQMATVAGWGWTNENPSKGRRSNILQKVNLSVVRNSQCQEWYQNGGKNIFVRETQMCAGYENGGKDACWADSGGPLMIQSRDGMEVVAIVSTGIGCARPKLPGLYTRLDSYIQWISDTLS